MLDLPYLSRFKAEIGVKDLEVADVYHQLPMWPGRVCRTNGSGCPLIIKDNVQNLGPQRTPIGCVLPKTRESFE